MLNGQEMTGSSRGTRRAGLVSLALSAVLSCVLAASAGAAPGDFLFSQAADINPGGGSSSPGPFVEMNGELYFGANDGVTGFELWKTTGNGATQVADVNEDPSSSLLDDLTAVDGNLFFSANGPSNVGNELFVTTGSGVNFFNLNTTVSGASSNPSDLTNVNGVFFFRASNGTDGEELWKIEPPYVAANFIDIATGMSDSSPSELTRVGTTLFFRADATGLNSELYKLEPPYTTPTLIDINGNAGSGSSPFELTDVNGTLLFAGNDGTNGTELWKSNGGIVTPGGTEMVENINTAAAGDSSPSSLKNVNGRLFFNASDTPPGSGSEPYTSESPFTAATTSRIADINPGTGDGGAGSFSGVNGTVFFSASDEGVFADIEPWMTTPPFTTATQVADINPSGGSGPSSEGYTDFNGTAFFGASDGTDFELYKSTGTGATEIDLGPGVGGSNAFGMTTFNGAMFFGAAVDPLGQELWKATIEGPAQPVVTPPATGSPAPVPAPKKKCKKRSGKKGAIAAKKCKKKRKK